MLSFVTPWLFAVAVAASLVVTGLHLLSVRTPPPLMLPTARFVPDGQARAVARQPKLNDVGLLLLRVMALLAIGAALAGIRWQRTSASELRLVIADEQWRGDSAWRDSVTRALAAEDALVEVRFASGVSREAGAALVTAVQQARALTAQHRSLSRVDLTVVLPATVNSVAGYTAWRSQWPGRVRAVSRAVPGELAMDSSTPRVQVVGAPRDDIVAAAFAGASTSGVPTVVISRDSAMAADTARSTTVVHWPLRGSPPGFEVHTTDTVGAVVANGTVLVGPFVRSARLRSAMRARLDSGSRASEPVQVLAWWSDGEPAVVETRRATGGCTRTVAVTLPVAGDLLLSADAAGLRTAISAPCGAGGVDTRALDIALSTGDSLAPAAAFRAASVAPSTSDPWWLTPALLALGIVVLLGEWWWRNRESAA